MPETTRILDGNGRPIIPPDGLRKKADRARKKVWACLLGVSTVLATVVAITGNGGKLWDAVFGGAPQPVPSSPSRDTIGGQDSREARPESGERGRSKGASGPSDERIVAEPEVTIVERSFVFLVAAWDYTNNSRTWNSEGLAAAFPDGGESRQLEREFSSEIMAPNLKIGEQITDVHVSATDKFWFVDGIDPRPFVSVSPARSTARPDGLVVRVELKDDPRNTTGVPGFGNHHPIQSFAIQYRATIRVRTTRPR